VRAEAGACGLCELLGSGSTRGSLRLGEEEGVVAIVHPAGRLPYEALIASIEHTGGGFDGALAPALRLLRDVVRRLRVVEGAVPWNAWLHDGGHWHIELVPRLSVLAGVELGAGIYVNTVAPEDAARALRNGTG
jgi:UDPglucose--hexose-1-phosphate uridylyltransferase